MAYFAGADADFDGSDDGWDSAWNILKEEGAGKKSAWHNFIVPKNLPLARASFAATRRSGNVRILSEYKFNEQHPGQGDSVFGITLKEDATRQIGKKEVHEATGIDLKATHEDSSTEIASLLSALHELVHWLSYPPQQGHSTVIRDFLGSTWAEGLVETVVEDILAVQQIPMHAAKSGAAVIDHSQNQIQSYPDQVAIARKLIDALGVQPVGEALFYGMNVSLVTAMRTRWVWKPAEFTVEFRKLRALVDGAQYGDATKRLDELNQRAQTTEGTKLRR